MLFYTLIDLSGDLIKANLDYKSSLRAGFISARFGFLDNRTCVYLRFCHASNMGLAT